MRRHKRDVMCSEALAAMKDAMREVQKKFDLTPAEYVDLAQQAASSAITYYLRDDIRIERHGNTDTPGGLHCDRKTPVSMEIVGRVLDSMLSARDIAHLPNELYDMVFNDVRKCLDDEFAEIPANKLTHQFANTLVNIVLTETEKGISNNAEYDAMTASILEHIRKALRV